jgi:hypothetical protein
MFPGKLLASFILMAAIATSAYAGSADAIRGALEDSKATQRGLTFYVHGASIPGVVVSFDDNTVIARSQAQGMIVIRTDRIDAVAGFVGGGERKAQ